MAKVASRQKRVMDILPMLEKGMERKDIVQKIRKTFGVSERSVDNAIKEAKKILEERNKQNEAIRQEQTTQALKESLNEAIISDLELEGILCTIATGNIKVEEIIKGEAVLRDISPMEQIAAIDKLYKKRGSYAPVKSANTDPNGNPVAPAPPFTDAQVKGILKGLKKK